MNEHYAIRLGFDGVEYPVESKLRRLDLHALSTVQLRRLIRSAQEKNLIKIK